MLPGGAGDLRAALVCSDVSIGAPRVLLLPRSQYVIARTAQEPKWRLIGKAKDGTVSSTMTLTLLCIVLVSLCFCYARMSPIICCPTAVLSLPHALAVRWIYFVLVLRGVVPHISALGSTLMSEYVHEGALN